ncbi:MAG: peptidase M23 [Bacteroidales bacterium]|nr:MAG: peptidase M23 [Bacteroidales bacterium]
MAKKTKKAKYHFNDETLSFERIEKSFLHFIKTIGIHLITGAIIGVILFFVISKLFPSPLEKMLTKENKKLRNRMTVIDRQINEMGNVISDLRQRDNNLYRVIFQADPIDLHHSTSRLTYDEISKMSNVQLINHMSRRTQELSKDIYVQSKSYDNVLDLAKQNEKRLLYIPGIQPVLNQNLSRVASGYGYRKDPVYHVKRFHAGMDFTAPIGTDIFATGNGKVAFTGWKQGYGNCVIIDHGFNYLTLYAHMSKIIVSNNQVVKRGEVIGLVGNTGKSTGPHLHYEVRLKNQPQDPRNYYFLDLSPEDYDKMIQLSENSGNILD